MRLARRAKFSASSAAESNCAMSGTAVHLLITAAAAAVASSVSCQRHRTPPLSSAHQVAPIARPR